MNDGWTNFTRSALVSGQFSRWPNEAMLKVLFGRYLAKPVPKPRRVLDVGCGMGQNLRPFWEAEYLAGVELTQSMVDDARTGLGDFGPRIDFRVGHNRSIPFDDWTFDLVLSVNAIHYERSEQDYRAALTEFRRVLKPGGHLYISTVAPLHEIRRSAMALGDRKFKIQNYDFRDGVTMCFFDVEKELAEVVGDVFSNVEVGRVTERIITRTLDFYIAVAER